MEPAYATYILPGMLMLGLGMGTAMMTSVSLATGGVAPRDSGAASATFNTAQQQVRFDRYGPPQYDRRHRHRPLRHRPRGGPGANRQLLEAKAAVHGFNVATWWAMASILLAALIAGVLVNADRVPTPGTVAKETPQQPVDTTL